MVKYLKPEHQKSHINPYCTKAGKLKITPKIYDAYFKFASLTGDTISYGLDYGECVPMVILGKNPEEMELPPIDFPLTVTSSNNRTCILIDLRQYITKNNFDPSVVSYMEFDTFIPRTATDTVRLLFRLGKIMSVLYGEEWSSLQKIMPILYKSYVLYLTTVYNSIVILPPEIKMVFESIASIYFYFLTNDNPLLDTDEHLLETKISKYGLINKLFFQYEHFKNTFVKYMLHTQNTPEETVRGFDTLEKIVSLDIQEEFSSRFKYDILVEKTANHWYGFGKKVTPLIALENLPLFAVMLEGIFASNSFNGGYFSSVLNKFKKVIDAGAFPGNSTKDYGKNIQEIFKY